MRHVTGRQGAADAGTGNALAINRHAAHRLDSKTKTDAGSFQLGKVPGTPLAEPEVVANDQMTHLQPAHQYLLDEGIRRQAGKPGVERADHRLLDAEIGQQFKLFAQRG